MKVVDAEYKMINEKKDLSGMIYAIVMWSFLITIILSVFALLLP